MMTGELLTPAQYWRRADAGYDDDDDDCNAQWLSVTGMVHFT